MYKTLTYSQFFNHKHFLNMKELLKLTKGTTGAAYLTFYHETPDILTLEWKGFVTVDLIVEAHKKSLDLIKNNRVTKIIEDVQNFTGPFSEANKWFIETYAPKVKRLGINHTAVILSSNIFTQLTVNQLKENEDFKKIGISYRVFESMNLAKNWLSESSNVVS